ncbi:MAG: glycosyltransferase family 9 protein [Acidobacteriota bacterium]|nr:glycosyltransferase family 9 protein [Acidobacteriota bacterium]
MMRKSRESGKDSGLPSSAGQASLATAPRILVARVGAIGDTLMVTPLLRALRTSLPGCRLCFLCSDSARDVLRYNPRLDRVIPLARWRAPSWFSGEKRRVISELRSENFDSVLFLESDARFLGLARAANCRRVIAYGALADAGGFERAELNPKSHMIQNHLNAAAPLGIEAAGLEMELAYPQEMDDALWMTLGAAGVRKDGILAGIHAGWGGRKHPLMETRLKSWPPERFAEIIRWLVNRVGASVVLTGTDADKGLNALIANLSGARCLNLAGKLTLLEMTALLRRLDVFLSVDSGPAHMAAAVGTPLVTLIGPAIIEQTAPLAGAGPVQILYRRAPCAPCYGTPLMKTCRDNVCMKSISTDEARLAVEQMLTARRASL